jgi:hypothetical protein
MSSHIRFFFRQCAYALGFFSSVVVAAEWLVPASVSPFLDPVPFALLAIGVLVADAMA